MMQNNINKEKLIEYWITSSDEDFETMIAMFETKRYSWALFVGHLLIEKLLKALFVKINNDYPPMIHNLLRLAEKCNIKLTDEQLLVFATITAFNINARYDDYKMSFQKKCTPEYSNIWVEHIKEYRIWIKELLIQ
ncbi:MAG TPA: HEPN domain-containing protein [Bacteroidales bacterium]|nr:MAG: HEPN domain protein [Bacteroidetes bacterium ADurb.Bin217]HOS83472.1 HEPN domain-containing protein [Bacteroidales bacterium]HPH15702.1 HEPN domain-containing protein [Bacteroidales bacterium]HPM13100.1 HEPN domain-containing protein [Bacteroidales bacterium]